MDTTSNALSLTLWRLAQNPHVQAKLRQEILDAQEAHGGADIEYDDLVALPYMDAVCRETLRIHVPAPFGFREVRKDTVLPLSEPVRGKDGRMMHELLVPKDTSVFVGINASNTNPALWGEDAHSVVRAHPSRSELCGNSAPASHICIKRRPGQQAVTGSSTIRTTLSKRGEHAGPPIGIVRVPGLRGAALFERVGRTAALGRGATLRQAGEASSRRRAQIGKMPCVLIAPTAQSSGRRHAVQIAPHKTPRAGRRRIPDPAPSSSRRTAQAAVRVSWTPRCRGQQPAQERVDVHGIRAVPTITAWCTSSAPSRVHEILCPRIEHDRVRQRRHTDMSGLFRRVVRRLSSHIVRNGETRTLIEGDNLGGKRARISESATTRCHPQTPSRRSREPCSSTWGRGANSPRPRVRSASGMRPYTAQRRDGAQCGPLRMHRSVLCLRTPPS
ncbi:hypothetical protein VTO73DRAFT_11395 [Trametes versicolor]